MRKTKRKHLKSIAADKHGSTTALASSPIPRVAVRTDVDEDSWVIVKKQRIRILIPSLPLTVQTHRGRSKGKQVQPGIKKRVKHRNKHSLINCSPEDASVKQTETNLSRFEEENEDGEHKKESASAARDVSIPPQSETAVATSRVVAQTCKLVAGSSDDRGLIQVSNDLVNQKDVEPNSNLRRQLDNILLDVGGEPEDSISRSQVAGESAPKEAEAIISAVSPQKQHEDHCLLPVQCLDESTVQVPNIRALVLQRKLELAGGISKWLISKGLERFVDMFQKERMGNLELLNLTMGRLKDMGLAAVGPRRKLIHAIDCLTQP